MNLKTSPLAVPCALFFAMGCANALGINDKRVLSDEEYRYYLDTGEIPTKDTDLSAYKDDAGSGGTFSEDPYRPNEPGLDDPGYQDPGGDGGGGSVEVPVEPNPREDFSSPDPAWADSYSAFDFEELGSFWFADANLMTDTLSGFARPAGNYAEFYPHEFLPEQTSPPYCMRGEVSQPGGYGALAVTVNEGYQGDIQELSPGGAGIVVDVDNLEGTPLVLHLLTDAEPGVPGSTYCTVLSGERPAFASYDSFTQNCEFGGGGQAYDQGTMPIQAIAVSTSVVVGTVPFNFCFFGMAEY